MWLERSEINQETVVLQRLDGTNIAAGTRIRIEFSEVRNPLHAGTFSGFTVHTTETGTMLGGKRIDTLTIYWVQGFIRSSPLRDRRTDPVEGSFCLPALALQFAAYAFTRAPARCFLALLLLGASGHIVASLENQAV